MPKSLAPCNTPGCPDHATRNGKCDTHADRATRDRARTTAPYQTPAWRTARALKLRLDPRCADCGAPATDADHDPITRRTLIARGITDPDAPHRLVSRCHPCHSRRTAQLRALR